MNLRTKLTAFFALCVTLALTAGSAFAQSPSADLFADVGTEVGLLTAAIVVLLGLALAPLLVFLGWKYLKRGTGKA